MTSTAVLLSGVGYTYPDGNEALHAVDLRVETGEKIALLGPNGAGKSTLLLHLNGILRGSGSVQVLGKTIDHSEKTVLRELRAQVGLVFQDPDDQLFSPTVADDVAFGPIHMGLDSLEVEARVDLALQAVGMQELRERMPHHMSGGEKRRSAIATVLSMRPKIIAADEPSSGLDPRARRELIALLKSLDQTLLVATHDLELARAVLPRSVLMSAGRIVADGPTNEILADAALLERAGL